jgi:hypothetical protein
MATTLNKGLKVDFYVATQINNAIKYFVSSVRYFAKTNSAISN